MRGWFDEDIPQTVAHELEHHIQSWNSQVFPGLATYGIQASSTKEIEQDANEIAKKVRKPRRRKKKWQVPGQ
jgi:hypothetical protein